MRKSVRCTQQVVMDRCLSLLDVSIKSEKNGFVITGVLPVPFSCLLPGLKKWKVSLAAADGHLSRL